MENFETILHQAKSLCEGDYRYIKDYCRIYTFTTENISGYLEYFDLKDRKLLTVGSSGDQVLNASFYGAKDITLYDINSFSKFYLYLKIAAIITLNYKFLSIP